VEYQAPGNAQASICHGLLQHAGDHTHLLGASSWHSTAQVFEGAVDEQGLFHQLPSCTFHKLVSLITKLKGDGCPTTALG
jgi:hypothetical protein